MKKVVRLGLAFLVIVLMGACTMKQGLSLTGKWQNKDTDQIIEFTSDGMMKSTVDGKTNQVSYTLVNNSTIEFFAGEVHLGAFDLRVDRSVLTLVDASGKEHRYKKTW